MCKKTQVRCLRKLYAYTSPYTFIFSDDTEYYCGGYYTCAVTSTLPAAAWQTYYYHDKYYDKFAICGGKSTTNPVTSKFQDRTLKFQDKISNLEKSFQFLSLERRVVMQQAITAVMI